MSLLSIPAGRIGAYEVNRVRVRHEEKFDAWTGRHTPAGVYTALFRHEVLPEGGTRPRIVMADWESEILQHQLLVRAYREHGGPVLLGGLGLGLAIELLMREPAKPSTITVVEVSPEVLQLVLPTYATRYPSLTLQPLCADIGYLTGLDDEYGVAWVDIWDTPHAGVFSEMTRLREILEPRTRWVGCWVEEMAEAVEKVGEWEPPRRP